jgi:hypothetical protein
VLRCGELNQAGILEAVAAILVRPKSHPAQGIFARDLVILRRSAGEWKTSPRASRIVRNDAGYVGIDYIDDTSPFWGNCINFYDTRPDGKKAFTISIQWRASENDTDPQPTDIAWDNTAGRYREIIADGFQIEVKKPPHRSP